MAGDKTVSVLVPVAVAAPYTYRAPADVEVGSIVEVPLGTRNTVGVIWDDPADPEIGHNRLRPIAGVFEAPPLSAEIRKFVDWVADYTLTSRGMVLRMVLRSTGALSPEPPVPGVRRAGPQPDRMTAARERVLAVAGEEGPTWTKSSLAAAGRRHVIGGAGADRRRHAGSRHAAGGAGGGSRLIQTTRRQHCRRRRKPVRRRSAKPSPAVATLCRSSTASPARARPKSISKLSRRR